MSFSDTSTNFKVFSGLVLTCALLGCGMVWSLNDAKRKAGTETAVAPDGRVMITPKPNATDTAAAPTSTTTPDQPMNPKEKFKDQIAKLTLQHR